jgi:5-methyltetrahydrofolate--homocysteine methyltransferase
VTDRSAEIRRAVCDGDQHETVRLVREAVAAGVPAQEVLSGALIPGMRDLGEKFKDGQAFLPEILISARAMNTGLAELQPLLAGHEGPPRGTVVLGTVAGDLHDIGKNLVGMLLRGNGFEVVDLGTDVSPSAFVAAVKQHDAQVVALSALLTTTTPQFRKTVAALDAAGLRAAVAVMVGGAPVSNALAEEVGADGFAEDCVSAVDEAAHLVASRAASSSGEQS